MICKGHCDAGKKRLRSNPGPRTAPQRRIRRTRRTVSEKEVGLTKLQKEARKEVGGTEAADQVEWQGMLTVKRLKEHEDHTLSS